MLWLVGVVLILQAFFYWIFLPTINFTTPLFELSGLGWLVLFFVAWLISGRVANKGPS